jgi:prevent-host-death family protein
MRTIEIEQAVGSLADYVQDVSDEPIVLTRNGQPYAAIVLYDVLEALSERNKTDILAPNEDEMLLDYLARIRAKRKAVGYTRSLEEVRERLDLTH